MRNFAQVIKNVALFPIITLVKTIKFDLGISGFKFDPGTTGGHYPDGFAQALLGNVVAILALGQYMGWDSDYYVVAFILCLLYMFIFGVFIFGLLWGFVGIHFPVGNWFYLPREGSPPTE